MSEKNHLPLLSENDLSSVSGGGVGPEAFEVRYSVGQMVRFNYICGDSKDNLVSYCWIGKIIEILQKSDGIFYRVELDEQARQIAGCPYMDLYFDCVF